MMVKWLCMARERALYWAGNCREERLKDVLQGVMP